MTESISQTKYLEMCSSSADLCVGNILKMDTPHILYNLKEKDFCLKTFEKFYTLANKLRTNSQLSKARIALHCSSERQFNIGKTLEDLASTGDSVLQLTCFRNLAEARNWLMRHEA